MATSDTDEPRRAPGLAKKVHPACSPESLEYDIHANEGTGGVPTEAASNTKIIHLCHRSGMFATAAESWESVSTAPLTALILTLCGMALAHLAYAVLFFGGFPWPTWSTFVPEAIFLCSGLYAWLGLYLSGPCFAKTRPFQISTVFSTPTVLYLSVAPFVGGAGVVPFGSRTIAAAGISVGLFCIQFPGLIVSQAQKDAAVEKVSGKGLLFTAVIGAIRGMNNLTDFGFVRILVTQVRRKECFWFGAPFACSKYIALAVLAAAFPTVAMAKDIIVTLGTQEEGKKQKRQRYLRPAVLLCQLGEVVVTLLKLFSDARTARTLSAAGASEVALRREVAFQLVSCGFSIATFTVSAIGLHRVMRAVRETAICVSQRATIVSSVFRVRPAPASVGSCKGRVGLAAAVHPGPAGDHQVQAHDLEQQDP